MEFRTENYFTVLPRFYLKSIRQHQVMFHRKYWVRNFHHINSYFALGSHVLHITNKIIIISEVNSLRASSLGLRYLPHPPRELVRRLRSESFPCQFYEASLQIKTLIRTLRVEFSQNNAHPINRKVQLCACFFPQINVPT